MTRASEAAVTEALAPVVDVEASLVALKQRLREDSRGSRARSLAQQRTRQSLPSGQQSAPQSPSPERRIGTSSDQRTRRRLFGTDGVRGVANADLTAELALGLSVAAAHVLA
ncbi:hypothetical protein ACWDR3_41225, partial [Streptomyces sp. NPDC001002]